MDVLLALKQTATSRKSFEPRMEESIRYTEAVL
jgi:hypothetical protein